MEHKYQKTQVVFIQDMLISLLATLLSILLVRWLSEPIPSFTLMIVKCLAVSAAGTAAGILLTGEHRVIRRFSTVRSTAKVLLMVLIKEAFLILAFITGLIKLPGAYAVLAILADSMLTCGIIVYIRVTARLLMQPSRDIKTQASSRTALVYGTGAASLKLASNLEKENYSVAGLISNEANMSGRVISDYVVYHCKDDSDLSRLQWQLGGIDCIFFPNEEPPKDSGSEHGDIVPQRDGMSFTGHFIKRSFDVGMSALLLLIFSPAIAICAILVKKEDGGPVIYSQERIGRGGKPFNIHKFRSMRVDAEAMGRPALYSGEEDPRLTRTGRFLRAHHLDELPQLWNVLKGDMSFIGYRPERQFYIDQIMARNSRYRYLYQIRPGVTSYATLYNGYTDTLEKMLTRLDLDLYYLRNHSVLFDAKVLGLTFLSIISGKKF